MAHYRILTEATNYKQIPRDICFLCSRKHMYVYLYYSVVSHVGVQKTMTYKRNHQDKYVSYGKREKNRNCCFMFIHKKLVSGRNRLKS